MIVSTVLNHITVNGNNIKVKSGFTLTDLLAQLELDKTMVAVEHNSEIVPKTEFSTRILSDGDRLEIVHFVGGG